MNNKITDANTILARYSLLFGILGVIAPFFAYPDGMYSGFVFCASAVALSSVSGKRGSRRGSAVAGGALGIIGAIFCVFLYYCFYIFYRAMADPVSGHEMLAIMKEFLKSYGLPFETFMSLLRGR